jgi:ATP-binding cassette, subfamily B, bacterial
MDERLQDMRSTARSGDEVVLMPERVSSSIEGIRHGANNTLDGKKPATRRSSVDPLALEPSGLVEAPRRLSMRSQLRPLLGDRRGSIAVLAISSVFSGFAEASVLAIVAQVATTLVNGVKHIHLAIGPFHTEVSVGALLAVAFVLAVIRIVLQVVVSYYPARIAAEVQGRLRRHMFAAFTQASWGVQSRDREGHLQEIMTSQIMQASQGALQATTLISWLFTFAVLVLSALILNVVAAAVVLTAAVMLFGLMRPINSLGARSARSLSQAQMSYAGGVGEANRVAEETRVFGVAAAQCSRIGRFIAVAEALYFRTQFVARLVPNVYQSLVYLVLIGGLAVLYGSGSGHVASLGAVVLLLVRAGLYGQQIQGSYTYVRQATPFIERLDQAERRYITSSPMSGQSSMSKVETLTFENVSFAYQPGRPVLSNINFEAYGSEAVGVVGPSGAGKSTLVQILLNLREPDEGRYLINGVPVQQFLQDDWYARVAYVPQEPRLVHASVAENIRYFRDLDDDAVVRGAHLARIHDDIESWPNGYETIVGPRADAVSGGQQQRICLARALAAQPEILILDEPTSALDPRSEALIQESLTALKHKITLFIIAHRMSTLDICDRTMVILDGHLDAFDTIAQLKSTNSYYRSASTLAVGVTGANAL